MSHFTTIAVQIKDIDVLRAARAELDLELAEKAEARGWGGNARHGDFVIRLKGPYDVALNRPTYGTCATEADFWNGHVERELGPNLGRLTVRRASRIEFDERRQMWAVTVGRSRKPVFFSPSRQECLEWEATHLSSRP